MRMLPYLLFWALSLLPFFSFGQEPFERKTIDIGNIGISLTNAGTVGRPDVRNTPQGEPSMEYPINSGVEHLFEGGLWIGAIVNGQKVVSTAAIDAATGYSTGAQGFEFTPMSSLQSRSSLTSSEFFSFDAISHQDYLYEMTDRFTIIGGQTIENHNLPLDADVEVETYAWNFSFADFFTILNFKITNNSTERWDSVYLGMWTDLIVRNVNVATDAGSAFFNKSGLGYVDSLESIYAFDVTGDPGYTNSYGASQFLGITWRDQFIHPANADNVEQAGFPRPKLNVNFWVFRSFQGNLFVGPFRFDGTFDDVLAYEKMRDGLNMDDPSILAQLKEPSNRTQLLSAGPLVSIEAGEEVNLVMALVGARQLSGTPDCPKGTEPSTPGANLDVPCAREALNSNLGWTKRTFNGEDINGNGLLDPGEDLDGDGELDRFILPEPPATPQVKFITESNKVSLYWDKRAESTIDPISKKQDFEGYRIYRTQVGDDFTLDMLGQAELIAQWDKKGNAVGFNNGFEQVRLQQPKTFEGDSIEYHYLFENEGLLNAWQYLYVLTAFDEGNEELELEPLESSFVENAFRVFVGTNPNEDFENTEVGVYPNPYRLSAAWDGSTDRTKKLVFYNLPAHCEVRIYTLSGDIVAAFDHNSSTYAGEDILWFDNFAGDVDQRIFSGGEHAWDILSESKQSITQGIYLFSVKDLSSGNIQQGRFAVLK